MAIFQNKIFLVLLCLIGVFAGTPALAGSNTAPSGEPFPKPSKNMEGCAAKLTVPCGLEIFVVLVATITTHQTIVARSSWQQE
jgi:hypothetical protein